MGAEQSQPAVAYQGSYLEQHVARQRNSPAFHRQSWQGVRPSVGADAYMVSEARRASVVAPPRHRELASTPPLLDGDSWMMVQMKFMQDWNG